MSGILYLVGTPIGNLEDLTLRAIRTLREVDVIAAEDTRVTCKLLNHLEIKKPMISYHQHNLREKGEEILGRLLSGQSCAIVTDAGMPCISDPGEDLVRLCAQNGVETRVVPGPSAALSALALSGLDTSRFVFYGFLPAQRGERTRELEELRREGRTLIFYEAPHRLLQTLEDLGAMLGNRRVAVARELTKVHEEVLRLTLEEAAALYRQQRPRGEFVLVVEGAPLQQELPATPEEAAALVRKLAQTGVPLSQAARDVARQTGHKKGELYKLALEAADAQNARGEPGDSPGQ